MRMERNKENEGDPIREAATRSIDLLEIDFDRSNRRAFKPDEKGIKESRGSSLSSKLSVVLRPEGPEGGVNSYLPHVPLK